MNITKLNQVVRTTAFAIASIAATAAATMPGASVAGTGFSMTGLSAISSSVIAAASCAAKSTTATGLRAYGVTEESKMKAIHRAKLRWAYDVHQKEGEKFSKYDNAQKGSNSIQCITEYDIHTICTVTARPCIG